MFGRGAVAAFLSMVATAFLLSSCGSDVPAGPGGTNVVEVDLPDGTVTACVIWDGYKAGGIDCNFK